MLFSTCFTPYSYGSLNVFVTLEITGVVKLKPKNSLYLQVVVQLVTLVLPASLNNNASAEDERHQEDSVPQLLQVLLQTHREERQYLNV